MAGVRTWLVRIAIGLVALLVVVVGSALTLGSLRFSQRYDVQTAGIALPDDPDALAHGEHLAHIHGCVDCHGADLSGAVMMDAPPFRVVATNLTSGAGGIGDEYDAEDFDRAIRHGVKPDGRPLIIMPSAAFHSMSDDDAAALIAYVRQVPPVDNELPATKVKALGRVMAAFAFDPASEVTEGRAGPGSVIPVKGPTAEYGRYLASMTCAYCHGEDLRGAVPPMPGSPEAPDLVARADAWSYDQWVETLRSGTTPDGRALDEEFMPVSLTRRMDDAELQALYAYLTRR